MKRAALLLLTILVIALWLVHEDSLQKSRVNIPTINLSAMDNPVARDAWLYKMLADPSTGKLPKNIRKKELEYTSRLPKNNQIKKSTSGLSWAKRGPFNIGGRTRAAAMDVTDENLLLAGGISGGIWRSEDQGTTWIKATTPGQHHSVTSLTQDKRPGKTNIWYAGTGERIGNSASGGSYWSSQYGGNGIYKSIDSGQTWDTIPATVTGTPHKIETWDYIWEIVVDPSAPDSLDILYSALPGQIYRSEDGGASWSLVLGIGFGASYYTDINISDSGVIYATIGSDGSQKGIWRSTDGITWAAITPVGFGGSYTRIVIGINPTDENEVYFLGNTPGSGQETFNFRGDSEWNSLWKYTYLSGNGSDTGGTWVDLSANLPMGPHPFDDFNSQGSYDLVCEVKPDDPNTLIIGGTNLYRSTDAFSSPNNWRHIGGYVEDTELPDFKIVENHHPDQHLVFFLPSNPNVMFSGSDGGLARTDNLLADTVKWTSLNNGYITTQFYTVAMDHGSNSDVILGGLQDNGTLHTYSSNPSDPWVMPLSYDGAWCAVEDGGGMYYMSIQNGRIVKATLDGQGLMTAYRRMDPIGGAGYLFINPFILDPADNNVMYLAAGNNIWRNDDLSSIALTNDFDSISTGWFNFPDSMTNGAEITALAASTTNPAHRLYIGLDSKSVFRYDNANTGSPTYTNITAGMVGNGYVECIDVHPDDADKVLVVYSNYSTYSLNYTDDGGSTWKQVAGNLEEDHGIPNAPPGYGNGPSIRWAKFIPVDGKDAYLVGTSSGLFGTDTLINDSTIWVMQGSNTIGNVVVTMIDYRPSDGTIVVATHGAGIYSSKITNASQITGGNTFNTPNSTMAVYPNPASEKCTLDFSLKTDDNITISIFDIQGRRIQSIMENERLENGKHRIQIKLNHLPGGSYIIALSGSSIQNTSKLIIG